MSLVYHHFPAELFFITQGDSQNCNGFFVVSFSSCGDGIVLMYSQSADHVSQEVGVRLWGDIDDITVAVGFELIAACAMCPVSGTQVPNGVKCTRACQKYGNT